MSMTKAKMTARASKCQMGWFLEWQNGYMSAMPTEQAARECALAPELVICLREFSDHAEELGQATTPEHIGDATANLILSAQKARELLSRLPQ